MMIKRFFTLSFLFVFLVCGTRSLSAQEQAIEPDPFTPLMLGILPVVQVPTARFDVTGLKLNVIYSQCDDFIGIDLGGISYKSGFSQGLSINAVNIETNGGGLQIHAWGHIAGSYEGVQVGAVNVAEDIAGLQFGVINIANTLYGVQIGVINIIKDNDFPFFPILNVYF